MTPESNAQTIQDFKIEHVQKSVDEIKTKLETAFVQQHEQWKLFFERDERHREETDKKVSHAREDLEKRMDEKVGGVYRWLVGGGSVIVVTAVLVGLGLK